MMRQLRRGGGMPGMPGHARHAGHGRPGKQGQGQGAGSARAGASSGNPAKRAEQERAAAQRGQQGVDKAIGSAFGAGALPGRRRDGLRRPPATPSTVTLPPGFEKFLGS